MKIISYMISVSYKLVLFKGEIVSLFIDCSYLQNSVALPVKSLQEKTAESSRQLRLQFPVSSGQHHRKTGELSDETAVLSYFSIND